MGDITNGQEPIVPELTITIPLKEYNMLKNTELWLECLNAAGVDNWQGYDFACEEYEKAQGSE